MQTVQETKNLGTQEKQKKHTKLVWCARWERITNGTEWEIETEKRRMKKEITRRKVVKYKWNEWRAWDWPNAEKTQLNIHFIMVKHRQKPLQMATIHAEIKLLSRGMRSFFPRIFSFSIPLSLSLSISFLFYFFFVHVLFYNNFVVSHSMGR